MVIVVLGIITAIAVPRLSTAADRTRTTAAQASAAEVQRAIDLYAAEHSERGPEIEPGGAVTSDPRTLITRLLGQTDHTGAPGGPFGPYLRQWPRNPVNGRSSVRIDGAPAGANTAGWRYDTVARRLEPDHSLGARFVDESPMVSASETVSVSKTTDLSDSADKAR